MATKKSQRAFIWFITLLMIAGTVVSFVVMILSSINQKSDQEQYKELSAQYQKDTDAYQKKVDAQTAALSKKYYNSFKPYASQPTKFNAIKVSKLAMEDLKIGTGKTLAKGDTDYAAYYIGWNPSGKVFDQSIDGKSLKQPLDPAQGLVDGWEQGVVGLKIGGVRLITMPADLAYGATGSGENIPPNTPIKFVVMAIPKPETISEPTIPPLLLQYYQQLYAQ